MAAPTTTVKAAPVGVIVIPAHGSSLKTAATQLVPELVPSSPLYTPFIIPGATLLGVGLTIWFGFAKLKRELVAAATQAEVEREQTRNQAALDRDHDADQARQERITSARRDVYVQLIGEMTKASMVLGALPAQQGDELDVQSGFGELLSAAAKVGILGQMDTVIKSRELGILIQEVLIKMLPSIIKMRWLKKEEENYSRNHETETSKAERFSAEIKRDIISGTEAQELKRLDELKVMIDRCYAEAEKNLLAAEKCSGEHFAALQEYQLEIIDETGKIAAKMNELIVCIRSELELDTDAEALLETTRQMRQSSVNSIQFLRETLARM